MSTAIPPIAGCSHCALPDGRLACPYHGPQVRHLVAPPGIEAMSDDLTAACEQLVADIIHGDAGVEHLRTFAREQRAVVEKQRAQLARHLNWWVSRQWELDWHTTQDGKTVLLKQAQKDAALLEQQAREGPP